MSELEARCAALLQDLQLCDASDIISVHRLTGGVASDIAAVRFGDQTVCAKFALSKLNVSEDWFAPLHRGRAEYAYLKFAGQVAPGSAPKLFGWSEQENGFAMAFIAGVDVTLWKDALLKQAPDQGEAVRVAKVLGAIHAASTARGFDASAFDNADDFDALRLEPYLRFTASRHPDLSENLVAMADALKQSRVALVHGDVSPKNILLNDGQPVLLDAECATMGDPAFDVAFLLNHLVLKSFHMPESCKVLRTSALEFWETYSKRVTWEPIEALEARVTALLPMLMLARIDGKSPVEYLNETTREDVRTASIPLITNPSKTLSAFMGRLK